MVKRLHLLLLLCIITSFIACKRDNEEMGSSSSDTNSASVAAKDSSIACLINGETWTATNIKAQYIEEHGVIRPLIRATSTTDSTTMMLNIQLRNVTKTGTYPVKHNGFREPHATATYHEFNKAGKREFRHHLEGSVELEAYDEKNKVVSGSFNFVLKGKQDSTKTLDITKGNFKHVRMEELVIKRKELTEEEKAKLRKRRDELEAAKKNGN